MLSHPMQISSTQSWSTPPDSQPQLSLRVHPTLPPPNCPLHSHVVSLATFSLCACFWNKHLFQAFRVNTVLQQRKIPRRDDWNKVTSILRGTLVPEAQPRSPTSLPALWPTLSLPALNNILLLHMPGQEVQSTQDVPKCEHTTCFAPKYSLENMEQLVAHLPCKEKELGTKPAVGARTGGNVFLAGFLPLQEQDGGGTDWRALSAPAPAASAIA